VIMIVVVIYYTINALFAMSTAAVVMGIIMMFIACICVYFGYASFRKNV